MIEPVTPKWLRWTGVAAAIGAVGLGVWFELEPAEPFRQAGLTVNLLASVATVGAALAVFDPIRSRYGARLARRRARQRFHSAHQLITEQLADAVAHLRDELGVADQAGEAPNADLVAIAADLRAAGGKLPSNEHSARVLALSASVFPLVIGDLVLRVRATGVSYTGYHAAFFASLAQTAALPEAERRAALAECCDIARAVLDYVRGGTNVELSEALP